MWNGQGGGGRQEQNTCSISKTSDATSSWFLRHLCKAFLHPTFAGYVPQTSKNNHLLSINWSSEILSEFQVAVHWNIAFMGLEHCDGLLENVIGSDGDARRSKSLGNSVNRVWDLLHYLYSLQLYRSGRGAMNMLPRCVGSHTVHNWFRTWYRTSFALPPAYACQDWQGIGPTIQRCKERGWGGWWNRNIVRMCSCGLNGKSRGCCLTGGGCRSLRYQGRRRWCGGFTARTEDVHPLGLRWHHLFDDFIKGEALGSEMFCTFEHLYYQ